MKTFYQFGLQTKRSDAQWAIWSILAAAIVNELANQTISTLRPAWDNAFVTAFAIAIGAGLALSFVWRKWWSRAPQLAGAGAIRAWDAIFVSLGERSRWVQVQTLHSGVISGRTLYAAKSVDTDDLDLYVVEPKLVQDDKFVDLPGVEGLLIQRSEIASLAVFAAKPSSAGRA
jgi:hypothetical protein